MGASRFVGRVGGLAMALGVGAAVFTGYGVAWADDSPSAGAGPKNTKQHSSAGSSGNAASHATKTKVGGSNNNGSGSASSQVDQVDTTVNANTFTGVAPSATAAKGSPAESVTALVQSVDTGASVAPTTPARVPASTTATVSSPVTASATAVVDPTSGDNPIVPVDSPVALALAAYTRREALGAASTTAPAAVNTTSAAKTR